MKNSSWKAPFPSWTCGNCPAHQSGIFSDLKADQLKVLEKGRILNRYAKGQILYYEGHHPMAAFCLLSGQVKVFKTLGAGGHHVQSVAGSGDLLGHECFLRKDAYEASAEAMEDSQVCVLPRGVVLPLLEKSPAVLLRIIDKVTEDFTRRQGAVSSAAQQRPVPVRLAALLLELNERFGRPVHWGSSMELALSRAEIASMVGTTTETTIRILNRFQARGILTLGHHAIDLKNIQALRDMAR
jgi:CRP/FNR family transcriptional regulator, polysaccharide utilization system transcription regulator